MARKRKEEFNSDQQSPSRKMNICLEREREYQERAPRESFVLLAVKLIAQEK